MTTSVAMIFVSTNEGAVLIPALESLLSQNLRHPLHVVVVDNVSTDGAKEEISQRWPHVQVLTRDKRYGLPANLNHGIRNTTSDHVMLCNSDLVFGPGAVDALADFLDSHPRAGIAAPKLISPNGATRPSARRWYTLFSLLALKGPWQDAFADHPIVRRSIYDEWDHSQSRMVDWVPCPATMVRRKSFEEVGLMDERFRLYFDDVDISLRMHEGGWEVWCVPTAEIVHIEQRASVKPFSRPWRWHLESLIKFWWKHKGLRPRRQVN
ncbi:MAG TPA: glycosyltransferase family 2 protein [Actinomycetota bacterium]|nr:glycosyltransferase family 2 protein [Actinomycetota bacterium]